MFDWGGEQMAYYLGHDLGELLIVTLNKYVLILRRFTLTDTLALQRRGSNTCHHSSTQLRVSAFISEHLFFSFLMLSTAA